MEIEIKIMCQPTVIPTFIQWLDDQSVLLTQQNFLANYYYDTPDLFFANQKMGLRVRQQNDDFELTLKTKGEIKNGLHIRPEYNLAIPNAEPDFIQLAKHFSLNFNNLQKIQQNLVLTFSTNFNRTIYLVEFAQSQIEIAIDQGEIKNQFGQEPICEIELELKQGNISDLFLFLVQIPKLDGMWLSNLSKAQRGYLVGNQIQIDHMLNRLFAEDYSQLTTEKQVIFRQQVLDFIRSPLADDRLITLYQQIDPKNQLNLVQLKQQLMSKNQFQQEINQLITEQKSH